MLFIVKITDYLLYFVFVSARLLAVSSQQET